MGHFDKEIVSTFLARVYNCADILKLLEKEFMQIVRSINLGKDRTVLIAYWMYSSGKNAFVKYDEDGNRMEVLKAKMFEINQNVLLKMQTLSSLEMIPVKYTCWKIRRRRCSLMSLLWQLHVFVQPKMKIYFAIGRFRLTGECKQYITPLLSSVSSNLNNENLNEF